MFQKRTLTDMIQFLKEDEAFSKQIVHWHTIEEKEAEYRDFPERLDENIVRALKKRGIEKLYSHQAEAFQGSTSGQNVTLVTPTASGKTCPSCSALPKIPMRGHYTFFRQKRCHRIKKAS